VERVRNASDIVALVGERVSLKPSGKNFRGLCPFHAEKTPSFYVYPESRSFYCFGCHASGDVFDWVEKTYGVDFKEALRILAQKAGISLTQKTFQEQETQRLLAVLESANLFFQRQLAESPLALQYVRKRGLDEATLKEWEIGYAPDESEALAGHLKKSGHTLRDAASAGLLYGDPQQGYQDFFRNRLIFPVRDARKRLVAFGGRALGPSEPKYLNSPDTPLFRKSALLYGLCHAKASLAKERTAVLTEGYLDVIACHRAGIKQAVASLGTSLTVEQLRLLGRACETLIFLYDNDEAGRKAVERALSLARSQGMGCKVVLLPPGEDADSVLRKFGAGELRLRVRSALTPLAFRLEVLKQTYRAEPGIADENFWREAIRILAENDSPMETEAHILTLSAWMPTAESDQRSAVEALRKEVRLAQRRRRPPLSPSPSKAESPVRKVPVKGPERTLLRSALHPEYRALVWRCLREDIFQTEPARRLAGLLAGLAEYPPPWDKEALLARLPDEAQGELRLLDEAKWDPLTPSAIESAYRRLEWEKRDRQLRERLRKNPEDREALEEWARLRGELK
ncbi:MAG: DNA primase, partial [Fimbriimonadales bacterium]|nr:DNA primase [Fimbriimonadales bacterium]